MKTLTPEKLAELESAANAATRGPWKKGRSYESVVAPDAPDVRCEAEHYGGAMVAESIFSPSDREFICLAREAVPDLCAEVRRLLPLSERVSTFVIAARRHREIDPTDPVDSHFFDQWVQNLASANETDPAHHLPCTVCGVEGHSAECPVDAYEARLRELTTALAGVLSRESDDPDFEEKWATAEAVCEREEAALGLRDPSTVAKPIARSAPTSVQRAQHFLDGLRRAPMIAVEELAVLIDEALADRGPHPACGVRMARKGTVLRCTEPLEHTWQHRRVENGNVVATWPLFPDEQRLADATERKIVHDALLRWAWDIKDGTAASSAVRQMAARILRAEHHGAKEGA